MIELHDLHFSWPDNKPSLRGLSFRIAAGEKVALLGANGSGKSTLLKVLDALVFASHGHWVFEGRAVTAALSRDATWARAFRRRVGLVFQDPSAMFFNPTVHDEIAYGPRRLGQPDAEARAEHWAACLGLQGLAARVPHALSGGQKQKLALAAVLALEPELLLLDEPAAHLDSASTGWLIDELAAEPRTVVLCTHSLALAQAVAQRALVLGSQGQLVFDGPLKNLLAEKAVMEDAQLAVASRCGHRGVS